MATKLGRMEAHVDGLLPIQPVVTNKAAWLFYHIILQDRVATIISPLSQYLWQQKLVG